MKTIVTIAVRMKSMRLAKKATADIVGKPLIAHLIERVRRAKKPAAILLCTSHLEEDNVLVAEAKRCGIPFVAGSADDVFDRFLEAAQKENAAHIVRVTGDNPLTDPEYIDRVIACHLEEKNDYTTADGLPLGVAAEAISVDAMKKAKRALEDPKKSEYMTFLLRDPAHYKIGVVSADASLRRPQYRLTVDTPQDLKLMRALFERLYPANPNFTLSDVIRLMDQEKDLMKINGEIEQRSLPS